MTELRDQLKLTSRKFVAKRRPLRLADELSFVKRKFQTDACTVFNMDRPPIPQSYPDISQAELFSTPTHFNHQINASAQPSLHYHIGSQPRSAVPPTQSNAQVSALTHGSRSYSSVAASMTVRSATFPSPASMVNAQNDGVRKKRKGAQGVLIPRNTIAPERTDLTCVHPASQTHQLNRENGSERGRNLIPENRLPDLSFCLRRSSHPFEAQNGNIPFENSFVTERQSTGVMSSSVEHISRPTTNRNSNLQVGNSQQRFNPNSNVEQCLNDVVQETCRTRTNPEHRSVPTFENGSTGVGSLPVAPTSQRTMRLSLGSTNGNKKSAVAQLADAAENILKHLVQSREEEKSRHIQIVGLLQDIRDAVPHLATRLEQVYTSVSTPKSTNQTAVMAPEVVQLATLAQVRV